MEVENRLKERRTLEEILELTPAAEAKTKAETVRDQLTICHISGMIMDIFDPKLDRNEKQRKKKMYTTSKRKRRTLPSMSIGKETCLR